MMSSQTAGTRGEKSREHRERELRARRGNTIVRQLGRDKPLSTIERKRTKHMVSDLPSPFDPSMVRYGVAPFRSSAMKEWD